MKEKKYIIKTQLTINHNSTSKVTNSSNGRKEITLQQKQENVQKILKRKEYYSQNVFNQCPVEYLKKGTLGEKYNHIKCSKKKKRMWGIERVEIMQYKQHILIT